MTNDLIAMVGLPRSGKTTYVQNVLKPKGYVSVCPDDVRKVIHGQTFIASAEPYVWATVYAMVDALRLSGHKVVVDACNVSRRRREPWTQRHAAFIVIPTSADVCLSRTAEMTLVGAIKRMKKDWQSVSDLEGVILEGEAWCLTA